MSCEFLARLEKVYRGWSVMVLVIMVWVIFLKGEFTKALNILYY